MDMMELAGYGIPAALIARWREQQGARLLPLQEQAVREYDLFGEGNLLVQAPTSSGKTFIGEMAAARAALQRRKTVYLLPLKALAEEKYHAFRARYEPYGVRVIVCTRDHRAFDGAFERGDFDIAVAVYEKLERLSVIRPERLREPALVVADELEVLSDAERGAGVELLLTRLRAAGTRIVGLSAVLGEPEQPAAWLNARLLEQDRRPRELRYGVLYEGRYRYCGHNDHTEGEETLETGYGETTWSEVMQNVRMLAEGGEPCLVFVKARREAWRGAELLSRRITLPTASETIEALRGLAPTRSRDLLLRTCETGTAFHSADLLPEERRLVEAGFQTGEIKALVATNTLATGMNLPARNVFLSTDKWIYDINLDLPWRSPITQGEFENMSGRAGRYGAGADYGRAILVAASPFDQDSLWRRYVKGRRETTRPRIAHAPFEDPILQLIASRCCRTVAELEAFFAQTLSARLVWAGRHSAEEIRFRLCAALRRCIEMEAVRAFDESGATITVGLDTPLGNLAFEASPLGRVIASKGLSLASARALCHWLRLSEDRAWYPLDLLATLALLPDARLRQVTLSRREYESGDYFNRLKKVTASRELHADTPVNRLRNCRVMPFYDEVRAIKTAMFLENWLDETALDTIEAEYDISAGQVRTAADTLSWLADAAAALADARNLATALITALGDFADRLNFGVREETLAVARVTPGLPRAALLALAGAGLTRPEALNKADTALLERWMDAAQANALKHWAAVETAPVGEKPGAETTTPLLVVDERRPGRILLNGTETPLQEKQYRLMLALARRPGECVPYEDIYRQIWGDIIVENNQIHYQKRMLVRRLAETDPAFAALIGAVPKRGFILKLAREQVCVVEAATHAA